MTTETEMIPAEELEGLPVRLLTETQARRLTKRIREAAETVWADLLTAREGKAHEALGYRTWDAYIAEEFGMSDRNARYLLDQGRVTMALREAVADGAGSALPAVSARTAAAVKPKLAKVKERVAAETKDLPAAEVPAVVDRIVAETVAESKAEIRMDPAGGYVEVGADGEAVIDVPSVPTPDYESRLEAGASFWEIKVPGEIWELLCGRAKRDRKDPQALAVEVLGAFVAGRLVPREVAAHDQSRPIHPRRDPKDVAARIAEVVRLTGEKVPQREIAQRLGISQSMVRKDLAGAEKPRHECCGALASGPHQNGCPDKPKR